LPRFPYTKYLPLFFCKVFFFFLQGLPLLILPQHECPSSVVTPPNSLCPQAPSPECSRSSLALTRLYGPIFPFPLLFFYRPRFVHAIAGKNLFGSPYNFIRSCFLSEQFPLIVFSPFSVNPFRCESNCPHSFPNFAYYRRWSALMLSFFCEGFCVSLVTPRPLL